MRILANYGYKSNEEQYSVTFETMGDVPQEKAPQMVDELFRLAKEAVQRQIKDNEATPYPDYYNGGNGSKGVKNLNAPPTEKQLSYIERLARRTGRKINIEEITTREEASQIIDDLSR